MGKLIISAVLLLLIGANSLVAQDRKLNSSNFVLTLNQDPAFGFSPAFNGVISWKENLEWTFYGVFWTKTAMKDNFGRQSFFNELGAGVNFIITDDGEEYLAVNPQIGIGNGNLCSGGGRPVFMDAIVPRLSVYYNTALLNVTFHTILYKGLRREASEQNYLDQFELIVAPSFNISKFFDVGLYFDLFQIKETKSKESRSSRIYVYYLWLGPSVNFKVSRNLSSKFVFGFDFVDYFDCRLEDKDKILKDFYKLSLSISF